MGSRSGASDELRRQAPGLFGGGAVAGLGDVELLERFLRRQTSGEVEAAEAAFGALVARHGGMVLGVCRRTLRNRQDAEDAFQAVFLVLARKAGSVRVDDSLGRWLYGVSRKVAVRARKRADRLRSREVTTTAIDAPEPSARGSAEAVADRDYLRVVILDELARLPGRYREAIEACDLDGCTHEEAARRLGWPVGTVRSRLSRGRARLRGRLERRGVGLPAVGLPAIRGLSDPVPLALASSTARAAVRFATLRVLDGSFPVAVAVLAQEALRTMTIAKLTVALPAALLIGGAAVATAQFGGQGRGGNAPPARVVNPPSSRSQVIGGIASQAGGQAETPPGAAASGGGGFGGGGGIGGVGALGGPQGGLSGSIGGFGGPVFEGAGKKITLRAGPIVLLRSETGDRFIAHNAETGNSATYRVPEGVTADPICDGSVIALHMTGANIREVAAYSAAFDTWVVHPLASPVDGQLPPTIFQGLAATWDGPRVYAFSSECGKWDTLERAEAAEGPPIFSKDYVLCEDDDRVYVFGARTGRWAAVEPK